MEYEDLFGPGDVDSSGDIVTPAEGIAWARQAILRLRPDAEGVRSQPMLEYSRSLVAEQERWLDALKASRTDAAA